MGRVSTLLDSHALLWWLADDRRLSKRARSTIADPDATVYVSAASVWEIAIKVALGKLADPTNAIPRFPAILAERGMTDLPISTAHAVEAASLPALHRDPFDRMLVAQSRLEGLSIVTNDPLLREYGVKTIW
jgi:PIN domain nuclease of toxin-antitoxin system